MTPAERVRHDPHFHMLVRFFYDAFEQHCGSGAGFTPTEIREASGYAWQCYAERHGSPMLVPFDDSLFVSSVTPPQAGP